MAVFILYQKRERRLSPSRVLFVCFFKVLDGLLQPRATEDLLTLVECRNHLAGTLLGLESHIPDLDEKNLQLIGQFGVFLEKFDAQMVEGGRPRLHLEGDVD